MFPIREMVTSALPDDSIMELEATSNEASQSSLSIDTVAVLVTPTAVAASAEEMESENVLVPSIWELSRMVTGMTFCVSPEAKVTVPELAV